MSSEPGPMPELTDELIAARRETGGRMPDDMPRWMAGTITTIDTLNLWAGQIFAWLTAPLIFAMMYEVIARYVFTAPTIWAYDVSRFLYGAMFVLGAGYALSKGVHIRSDFLYRDWSVKTQGRVDLVLYVLFFFPTMLILLWVSGDWALTSLMRGERGSDTAWAPLLGPVRMALPIGIALLTLQGVAETLRALYAAKSGRWP
ncbi:MAG TPA: TRAP transporter small permease subunit [Hyphomicrobiaceae bacterium]|nr:TRAP transporter small permease subunit [Hyphomicrobiaceae bacterium]